MLVPGTTTPVSYQWTSPDLCKSVHLQYSVVSYFACNMAVYELLLDQGSSLVLSI